MAHDIEVPEHPILTFKGFWIHIATVTIGLLIGFALDKGAEALVNHGKLSELRLALKADTQKAASDADGQAALMKLRAEWLDARLVQVRDALTNKTPIALPPKSSHKTTDLPMDPSWNAARTNGELYLMPREQIQAYSEIDLMITSLGPAIEAQKLVSSRRRAFEAEFADSKEPATPDFSSASTQDLRQYIELLSEARNGFNSIGGICAEISGAETAILDYGADISQEALETSEHAALEQYSKPAKN